MNKKRTELETKAEQYILRTIANNTKVLFPILAGFEFSILFRLIIHSDSLSYRVHFEINAVLFLIIESFLLFILKNTLKDNKEPNYKIIKINQYFLALSILIWVLGLNYHDLKTSGYLSIISFLCVMTSIPLFFYIDKYFLALIQILSFATEFVLAYRTEFAGNYRFVVEYTVYAIVTIITTYYLSRVRFNSYIQRVELDEYAKKEEKDAYTDALTGIPNRRAYAKDIENLNDLENKVISIIILDLNGLKVLNDNHGHNVGDNAICTLANALVKVFDGVGTCYRTGGDEFAIIIETHKEKCLDYLYKLNAELETWRDTHQMPLTVSFGYADTSDSTNILDIIKLADQRMYENKNNYYKSHRIDRRKSSTFNEVTD